MGHEKISKKAIWCMFIATAIGAVIYNLFIGGIWLAFRDILPNFVKVIMGVAMGISIIHLLISPKIRYERYRYAITEDAIDVKEGFIFIKRNIVPIERLHKIAIEKGPIDRMFNLAKVIVTTAGGDVVIRFLVDEKSEFKAVVRMKKITEFDIEYKNKGIHE